MAHALAQCLLHVWCIHNGHRTLRAGSIYPASGPTTKSVGRAVGERFGPVTGWAANYSAAEPSITLTTAAADYAVSKPATAFRALFTDAHEQVQLCHAIVQTVKGKEGQTQLFEATLASLNRARAVKGYMSVRDAVLLNGSFILSQMVQMQRSVGSDAVLADCTFFVGLREEVCAVDISGKYITLLHFTLLTPHQHSMRPGQRTTGVQTC